MAVISGTRIKNIWREVAEHFSSAQEESPQRGVISSIEMRNPMVNVGRAIVFLILFGVLLTMAFPLYWLFTGAFKTPVENALYPPTLWPQHFNLDNFIFIWNAIDWLSAFRNTLVLAVVGWAFGALIQTMAAYSFSMIRPAFSVVILFIFMCTIMIPMITLLIPQYINILDLPLFGWNLSGTPFAVWSIGVFNAGAIFIYKLFFDQVPQDLIDCARVEGASHLTIYARICLPMIRPALVVGLINSFIADWTGYLWPKLTLDGSGWEPVGLALLKAQPLATQFQITAAVIGCIVPFILVALFQNQIIKSNAAYAGLKG